MQADGRGGAAAAASGPAASDGERDVPPPSGRAAAMARSAAGPPTSDADGHRHSVALGVLTESRESARFKAMESTWLTQFDSVMVFESHTESVSRVQQIWKYVPQRLYERFPGAHFFLIIDDDVFIHHKLLLDFVHHRDPQALVLYGPGFCDWGVKADLKAQISAALGMPMPEYIHVVIGGIMLFTAAAVR